MKTRRSYKRQNNMTQVTEHLFIGNKRAAKDLNQLKNYQITHVINCAKEIKGCPEGMNYLWLPMIDNYDEGDVSTHIPQAIEFIDAAIEGDHKVLIHCAAGISRSSSITIAYMMYKNHLAYEEALRLITTQRPCCKPNRKFAEQLKSYDFNR